jgi:hypothetical protein
MANSLRVASYPGNAVLFVYRQRGTNASSATDHREIPMTATAQTTSTQAVTTTGNTIYYIAKLITLGFAAGCLYFSFSHTILLAQMLGASGAQAYTSPAFIDGIMLLGRLGMAEAFDATTRKIGRWMLVGGALLSLAANIAAGRNAGERILGGLVVGGFLLTEWYAGKLKPAPPAELTPQQKAAATRARNAAAKPPAKRKPATKTTTSKPRTRKAAAKPATTPAHPVAAIQALPTTLPVPVSGAPVSYNNGLVIAYSLDDIPALTN